MLRKPLIAICMAMGLASASTWCAAGIAAGEYREAPRQAMVHLAEASNEAAEKEAFTSAKELGTVEAWDAFLTHYPGGFRADLARAYVKQLGGRSVAAPVAPAAVAGGCTVTFVRHSSGEFNKTTGWAEQGKAGRTIFRFEEMGRSASGIELYDASRGVSLTLDIENRVIWYKEAGSPRQKLYDILETNCERAAPQLEAAPQRSDSPRPPEPKYFTTRPKPASTECGSGKTRVDGNCIRRADVPAYCGPGYRMRHGKCVHGAYEAPKAKDGPPTGSRKAESHGCPKGQVWTAAEGCHEDD